MLAAALPSLVKVALAVFAAFVFFAVGIHTWNGASVGFLRVYQAPNKVGAVLLFILAAWFGFQAIRHLVAAFSG
jgi:hypothetical protein